MIPAPEVTGGSCLFEHRYLKAFMMWKILLEKINRGFDVLLSLAAILCGAMICFVVISVCYDVGARYLFNAPTSWITETAAFILLILPFLAAAWVLKQGTHVRMDVIYDALKKRNKYVVDAITSFLSILVCLILVWRGTLVTIDLFNQKTLTLTTLRVIQWPFMAVIPLGMFLFLIEYLRRFIRAISLLFAKT
jgi:TRAP-type C4-dicarboxylate transport system permease small subunit